MRPSVIIALPAPDGIECGCGPDDTCSRIYPLPGIRLARVRRNRCLRDAHSLKELLSKIVEFQYPGKRCETPKSWQHTELSGKGAQSVSYTHLTLPTIYSV